MKFENVKCVAEGEVLKALDQLVAESDSQSDAAKKIGVYPNHLSAVRSGAAGPGRKILEFLGLQERRVIVAKTQGE